MGEAMMEKRWLMPVIGLSILAVAVGAGLMIQMRNVGRVNAAAAVSTVAAAVAGPTKERIGVECPGIPSPVVEPGALAVDETGKIYVGGKGAVSVLGADGREGVRFAVGTAVTCLAVDGDGNILAGGGDRILVYDREGTRVAEWAIPGSKTILTSLAVDEGVVYAADAGQHCVWRLNREGKVLGSIRRAVGEYVIPSPYFDVAVGTGDGVWVVDPGRHEVVSYSPEGEVRTSWGRSGSEEDGFCGCCNPTHIVVMSDGSFVTAEKGIARVKKLSATGEYIGMIAGPELFSGGTRIADLAVDGAGRVLVLDPVLKVIRIFDLSTQASHRDARL